MEVYEYLSALYAECRKIRVKKMTGIAFIEEHKNFEEFLKNEAYVSSFEYIGHFEGIHNNKQHQLSQSNQNNDLVYGRKNTLGEELVSKALKCLKILSGIP